jgi:hypothetical protein
MTSSTRRYRPAVPGVAMLALAACSQGPDTSLLDAYLAPQPPKWAGLPPPSPVPEIARNTRLIGMPTNDLRSVFGEPALVRKEGSVQYWRYSFAGCTLDLFVNTLADGSSEVAFFDLRASDLYGNGIAAAECERLGSHLQDIEVVVPGAEAPTTQSF